MVSPLVFCARVARLKGGAAGNLVDLTVVEIAGITSCKHADDIARFCMFLFLFFFFTRLTIYS